MSLGAPALCVGLDVAVTARGNDLHLLTKFVPGVSEESLIRLVAPNDEPLVYEFDPGLAVRRKRLLTASPQRPSEIL